MPGMFKRFAETFMSCFVFSAPLAFLLLYEYVEATPFNTGAVMIISALLYISASVYFLRSYFVCFRDLKLYYIVNYAIYGIFVIVSSALLLLFDCIKLPALYTLLLLPLRVFEIFVDNSWVSAGIFHIVMLIVIYISPLTTNLDMLEELDDIEEREQEVGKRLMDNE